jgi:hypothetical protein
MAVTIHSSPNNFTPSGNPLVFVFSSDETAQDNFSYSIDISVDGNVIETHEVFPEVGIKAHIDCSDVAERYCNKIFPLTSALEFSSANFVEVEVEVFEKYGTTPTRQSSATSTINTYKGKLSKSKFLSLLQNSYIFADSKLWLSFFPRNIKRYINLSTPNFYTFITNEEDVQLEVNCYDSTDSLIFTYAPAIATSTSLTTYYFDNAILLGIGMSQQEIDDTSYFTIHVQTAAAAIVSEVLTIWIDDRDYSNTYKHLVFMSSIGGLEPFTFIKRSRTKLKVKGEPFQETFGRLDDSGVFGYTLGGSTDYVKKIENKLEVQTDWLNEDEQHWLINELLTSPLVFLFEDDNLIPVRITDTGGEEKTSENDMVFLEKFMIHKNNDTSTVV